MSARHVVAVLLSVAASVCGGCSTGDVRQSDEKPRAPAFMALLADGMLVGYSASGGEMGRVRVGGRLRSPVSGAYIATLGDGRVAVIDAAARPNRLVVVDVVRWLVVRRTALPRGSVFRNLVVGAGTGNLYIAGDSPSDAITPFGSVANGATLAVLNADGNLLYSALLRRPSTTRGPVAPYDWSVYSLSVHPEEKQIYISYHGPNTSGADTITNTGESLIRCRRSGAGGVGCLTSVHGRIAAFRDRVLAAGGTPPHLVEFRIEGAVITRWRSGFAKSAHLMEFARAGDRVFGLESCPKLGGLTSIDLERRQARMLAAPAAPGTTHPPGVCGERIAARTRDLRLAIAKTSDPLAFVLIVDGATGRILASRRVAQPAVDIAALE